MPGLLGHAGGDQERSPLPSMSSIDCFAALRTNEVVPLPRSVDQQEAERFRLAQIADFVFISGRHGAKGAHRHWNCAGSILALETDFTRPGDHKEQVPGTCMDMRGQ